MLLLLRRRRGGLVKKRVLWIVFFFVILSVEKLESFKCSEHIVEAVIEHFAKDGSFNVTVFSKDLGV